MSLSLLEEALLPYERKLQSQERLRRRLGVREVDRPTYERYITGPVERFDRRKNGFMTMVEGNPFGEDFRDKLRKRIGDDFLAPPRYAELSVEARMEFSLAQAASKVNDDYRPELPPVTPAETRVPVSDPTWMTRFIKKAGLLFGAEMVRIARLDQRWMYEGLDIPHKYAILIVDTHIPSLMHTAPSHLTELGTEEIYARLKITANQLADLIRRLGYDAVDRETSGFDPAMLMVPLAIDAGIGEFSRMGMVLSPEFGTNMRLRAITTDLPLDADRPISFNVHDFCMSCEICAQRCPAKAIPLGPPTDKPTDYHNNTGCRKWFINSERCLSYIYADRKTWTNCARCIAFCPWNKSLNLMHNAVRWSAIHFPTALKKLLISGDEMTHLRHRRDNKWRGPIAR